MTENYDDYDLNNPNYHPDSDEVTEDKNGELVYEDGLGQNQDDEADKDTQFFTHFDKASNDWQDRHLYYEKQMQK